MKDVLHVFGNQHRRREHCFAVQTPNRTYILSADSKKEREQWIDLLTTHVGAGAEDTEESSAGKEGEEEAEAAAE